MAIVMRNDEYMSKKLARSGKSRLNIMGIAIVPVLIVVGLVVLVAFVAPKILNKSGSSKTTTGQTSEPDADGWVTYHQAEYGYSIRHPQGWSVDDSTFPDDQEILIVDSSKNGVVKINSYQDRTINSQESVIASIAAFEEKLSNDPNIKLVSFKEDFQDPVGGFLAQGEQTINGEKFNFVNRGLVATNNRILIFHGATKTAVAGQYGNTTLRIIESFALDSNE